MTDPRLENLDADVDVEEVTRKLAEFDDARQREEDAASEASLLADELEDMGVKVDLT